MRRVFASLSPSCERGRLRQRAPEADLAKAVRVLAGEGRETPELNATQLADVEAGVVGSNVHIINNAASDGARTAGRHKARPPADAYPKFYRRGDELVKVGWSKKDRKEYNHRASRDAVDAVAASIRQVGMKGKLFKGDALLQLESPTDGSHIPNYQVYVALAWLRRLGVVKQHGLRAGYTVALEKQINSTITAAWPELPEWRG